MNTIIIEHADNKTTDAIRQLMDVIGLPMKTKEEKQLNTITNPEIIEAIERYEAGKSNLTPFTKQFKEELLNNAHGV